MKLAIALIALLAAACAHVGTNPNPLPVGSTNQALLDFATDTIGTLLGYIHSPDAVATFESGARITKESGDVIGERCFSWGLAEAQEQRGQVTQPVGPIGGWAALRRTRLTLQQSTFIRDFELNCGPLLMDEKMTIGGFLTRLGLHH